MTSDQSVPLRRVFRVINGGTPTSDPENWDGSVPWATPVDLGAVSRTIEKTQRTLTPLGARTGSRIVPAGSLILSTRAPIGYVAVANTALAFNQGCRALVPTTPLDIRYFYYQLSAATPYLQSLGQGSTFQELSSEALANYVVRVPGVEEQRRIANFLDLETGRIDQLEALTEQQKSLESKRLAESIRLATTTSLGSPNRETGLSWMPLASDAWPLLKISYAFSTGSGTTPSSSNAKYFEGDVPWVNSGDIVDGPIVATAKAVTSEALRDYPALNIFPSGALVVAMYGAGATKGRVGILNVSACVNQACCVLIGAGRITTEFAYYWFRSHREGIVQLATGAGQPNLSQELIRALKMPAPTLDEQAAVVRRIRREEDASRVKIEALGKRQTLLAERRRALITAAVMGKIDPTTARSVEV